ncbi:MAG: pilus assembly protein [Kiloniellaceae bacterium]
MLIRTLKGAKRNLARCWRDRRGNVSLMFGFFAIALTGGVGLAIDTSVAYSVRSQLAAAVDAAALAGARAFSDPDRDDDIRSFFAANFEDGYMGAELEPLQIVPDPQARTITVTARATIPTFFMRLLGTDFTDIAATGQATLSSRDVEVSLVLDITGSMDPSEMADLKAAANALIDLVVQDEQDPFRTRVALVPYSNSVNVGSYAEDVRGAVTAGTTCVYSAEPTCENFRFPSFEGDWVTFGITSCVTERTGPYLSTDDAPDTALTRLGKQYSHSSRNRCPDPEIMPLSSNRDALKEAVEDLSAAGSTAGHIGVAWGWYMISPNFADLWPEANRPMNYGEVNLGRKVLKVVVIMTDGVFNTIYYDGVIAKNSGTGSGYAIDKINRNGVNGNGYSQALALCDNMKAEGVEVYTVGFAEASSGTPAEFMEDCATDAAHVYLPSSGADLQQAFRDIAAQIARLHISM